MSELTGLLIGIAPVPTALAWCNRVLGVMPADYELVSPVPASR